jgi:group I intron endonuclease
MKNTGFYKIQSKLYPEKFYIGSSADIELRWLGHKHALIKGTHHSQKLQQHFNKFGIDDLDFVIIQICSKYLTVDLEQYYIDTLNPFFNIYKKVTHCRIAQNKTDYYNSLVTKPEEKRWKQGNSYYYSSCY